MFALNRMLASPWQSILFIVVIWLASAAGMSALTFNGDYTIYFEKNNPQRVAYEQMQGDFSKNDTVNFLVSPQQSTVFNTTTLTLVSQLTEAAWQIPLSNRVDSVTNFQYTWSEYDDLIVENLIEDDVEITPQLIERAKKVSISEPSLLNRMISADGKATLIAVSVNLPDGDKTTATDQIARFAENLQQEFLQKFPDHTIVLTGSVMLNDAFVTEAKADTQTLIPFMFIIVIVLLWVLLQSAYYMLATTCVVIMSITTTMGIGGWLGFELTTATVNVPTLVMTLAVADCVHIVSSKIFLYQQKGDKRQAVIESVRINFSPVLITSATTAIGFLTLNFSDVPALANLGTLTAIGIFVAFALAITLLPLLLTILPTKMQKTAHQQSFGLPTLSQFVIKQHRKIVPTTLMLVAGFAYLALGNTVNDIPTDYFENDAPFKQAVDIQNDKLGGMSTINFALNSQQTSGINDVSVLETIDSFATWLRIQPEVDHVSSITDTLKRLNKNMHGDDDSFYRLPDNRALAAQFLLLYELSLPFNLGLDNQLNMDKSATRLVLTMKNLGSKEFTEFETRAFQWIEKNAPNLLITSGSQNLMFAHIGERNMKSMIEGTLIALVIISGIIGIALKSLRLGLFSLLPNILPAVVGFGIWGVLSGQINMGLSVVLSMALGIIVDDTVHFLTKYRLAKQQGMSPEQAIEYSFSSVGKALVITTIILASGFAVLSLSSFAVNSEMGLLTGIVIVVALVIDLVFLSAILVLLDRQKTKDQKHEISQQNAAV